MLYYAQGCFLAVTGNPLFSDKLVAWRNGPVVKSIYEEYSSCGNAGIQFDDDFRYGHLDGGMLGCACKNHLDYVGKLLGEPIDRETLQKHALSGGKNKYRDAWQESKGYYFELFSKEMREAVDAVNPNIRMGLCSCMTTWDIDGTDAATLSRILAGNTKPFLRTIGAPYWAVDEGLGAS